MGDTVFKILLFIALFILGVWLSGFVRINLGIKPVNPTEIIGTRGWCEKQGGKPIYVGYSGSWNCEF